MTKIIINTVSAHIKMYSTAIDGLEKKVLSKNRTKQCAKKLRKIILDFTQKECVLQNASTAQLNELNMLYERLQNLT